jgi:hypothetical protein
MNKNRDFLSAIAIIMISLAILCALAWSLFGPEKKNQEIIFNVVGIENYTENATTLISIHYECIKYCAGHFQDGTQGEYKCYEECSKLGSEGCGK